MSQCNEIIAVNAELYNEYKALHLKGSYPEEKLLLHPEFEKADIALSRGETVLLLDNEDEIIGHMDQDPINGTITKYGLFWKTW